MDHQVKNKKWNLGQLTVFRFFFIFIGLNTWCINNVLRPIFYPRYKSFIDGISVFPKPLYWLDRHIYHFGVKPPMGYNTVSLDSPLDWAMMITILWISLAGCIIWGILDRQRANYHRLDYWFRMYLAWYLFIMMAFYAIFKITMAQMPFPNAEGLFKPLGNYSRVFLLFNFMGASPGYSIFTGVCEFLVAVLVLSRRTRVLGALLMLAILVNILSLNIFYNVMQKLLVINLLIVTLYILSPFLSRLANIFIFLKPDSLLEETYHFNTPWKKYLLSALLIIPVWVSFATVLRGIEVARSDQFRKQQKVYRVMSFVSDGGTLPPLLTDQLRIQKIAFTAMYAHQYLVVYDMSGVPSRFDYVRDTIKKTITFPGAQLTYKDLTGDKLELDGQWRKHQVSMLLAPMRLDTLPLVKEKINWVR
jgi:hypothetical protein